MTAASWAALVSCKPIPHVLNVPTVSAPLAPSVLPFHRQVTNRTRVGQPLALFRAMPRRPRRDWLLAGAAAQRDGCRVRAEVLNLFAFREVYHPRPFGKELQPLQQLAVRMVPKQNTDRNDVDVAIHVRARQHR